MSGFAALLRRDRFILCGGLMAVAVVAWAYLLYEAQRMNVSGVCECLRMRIGGADHSTWPATTLVPLFFMWSVMMVAMMLPTAVPMVLTFGAVTNHRRHLGRPYVPTIIFVCGYLAVWVVFSVMAAVAQWLLHRHALLSESMTTTSAVLGGALLIVAGIFQFTPLKHRCLTRCRGTLEFILTRWREGRSAAFRMGLEHGVFCTGCCWALMALLFVTGVMNMYWVAGLMIFVCLEKILPARARLNLASGVALVIWGLLILSLH